MIVWWCYNEYNETALFVIIGDGALYNNAFAIMHPVDNAHGGAIINNGIIALSIITLGGVCSEAES
jgi:hypothetical protein